MSITLLLPIIVFDLLLLVIALRDLIHRSNSDILFGKKWPWVLFIILIHPIGAIFYLTTGRLN